MRFYANINYSGKGIFPDFTLDCGRDSGMAPDNPLAGPAEKALFRSRFIPICNSMEIQV
jgi:hypothetical protein